MHDENYKRIFASPRVIEDLLRGFVPGNWIEEVDFATLGKLSTEYISDELLKRHGDNVWRMRLRSNWLYLLLLVEFQSTDDPLMALRILTYTGLLYQCGGRSRTGCGRSWSGWCRAGRSCRRYGSWRT